MTSQELSQSIKTLNPLDYLKSSRKGDPRLAETVLRLQWDQLKDLNDSWVLLGHPDDEGICFNKGRMGSAKGPEFIRKYLYNLVALNKKIYDLGDTNSIQNLSIKHEVSTFLADNIFKNNKLMSFGGGHDYAYPDIKAFLKKYPDSIVLNIDAHLDMRPMDPEPHSGTAFRRLFEEGFKYTLFQIGYQKCFTSLEQIEFAKKMKVQLIGMDELAQAEEQILGAIKAAKHIFLSVDIDAFSSALAPGASAAWPIGLQWLQVSKIFKACFESKALKGMGIYEVSPPLDENDKTSKLAAQIAYMALEV